MLNASKSTEFQLVLVKQVSPATVINVSTSMNVRFQVHLNVVQTNSVSILLDHTNANVSMVILRGTGIPVRISTSVELAKMTVIETHRAKTH